MSKFKLSQSRKEERQDESRPHDKISLVLQIYQTNNAAPRLPWCRITHNPPPGTWTPAMLVLSPSWPLIGRQHSIVAPDWTRGLGYQISRLGSGACFVGDRKEIRDTMSLRKLLFYTFTTMERIYFVIIKYFKVRYRNLEWGIFGIMSKGKDFLNSNASQLHVLTHYVF